MPEPKICGHFFVRLLLLTSLNPFHPESYLAGEQPVAMQPPTLTALEDAGYTSLPEDTLGELELRIFFAHAGAPAQKAEQAAAGWGGDVLQVYLGPNGEQVALWLLAWDRVTDAEEAASMARWQQRHLPAAARMLAAVLHTRQHLLVVRGLPRRYHGQLPSLLDRAEAAH